MRARPEGREDGEELVDQLPRGGRRARLVGRVGPGREDADERRRDVVELLCLLAALVSAPGQGSRQGQTHETDAQWLEGLDRARVANGQRRPADLERQLRPHLHRRRVVTYEAVAEAQRPDPVAEPLLGHEQVRELDGPRLVLRPEPVLRRGDALEVPSQPDLEGQRPLDGERTAVDPAAAAPAVDKVFVDEVEPALGPFSVMPLEARESEGAQLQMRSEEVDAVVVDRRQQSRDQSARLSPQGQRVVPLQRVCPGSTRMSSQSVSEVPDEPLGDGEDQVCSKPSVLFVERERCHRGRVGDIHQLHQADGLLKLEPRRLMFLQAEEAREQVESARVRQPPVGSETRGDLRGHHAVEVWKLAQAQHCPLAARLVEQLHRLSRPVALLLVLRRLDGLYHGQGGHREEHRPEVALLVMFASVDPRLKPELRKDRDRRMQLPTMLQVLLCQTGEGGGRTRSKKVCSISSIRLLCIAEASLAGGR